MGQYKLTSKPWLVLDPNMLYDGSLKSSGHRQIAQFDQPDSACQSFPKEVGNDVAQDAQMHNLAATASAFFYCSSSTIYKLFYSSTANKVSLYCCKQEAFESTPMFVKTGICFHGVLPCSVQACVSNLLRRLDMKSRRR